MNKIYEVNGTLNKGFVGQISYTVCLQATYNEMAIDFSFNKQHYDIITDDLKQWLIDECKGRYNMASASDKVLTQTLKGMKSELQVIVTMNDTFIGGVHRQENPKHLYFSNEQTTEGCMPQSSIHGVIKITLVIFSIISDDTHYALALSAS